MFERVKVLATGRFFVASPQVALIGRTLNEIMDTTRNELIIVAYRLTAGSKEFHAALERLLNRGCRVTLIIDCPNKEDESVRRSNDYLNSMLIIHQQLEIWDFIGTPTAGANDYSGQLHAKAVVSDRKKAIIGSANFSRNGLLENHELAVLVNGRPALAVAKSIDKMLSDARASGFAVPRKR